MSSRVERIISRFFKFVDKESNPPCWMWTGAKAGGREKHQRYGYFRPTWFKGDRKQDYAHRVSYIIHFELLLPEDTILHSCDTPLCVNPDHIFKGTQQLNVDDMVSKNRHTFGERNGMAILSEQDIADVFIMRANGMFHHEIASKFGVSRPTISLILEGKNWKHMVAHG